MLLIVQATTVVFDKTGTLTTGKPSVTGVVSLTQEWTTDRVSRVRITVSRLFLRANYFFFLLVPVCDEKKIVSRQKYAVFLCLQFAAGNPCSPENMHLFYTPHLKPPQSVKSFFCVTHCCDVVAVFGQKQKNSMFAPSLPLALSTGIYRVCRGSLDNVPFFCFLGGCLPALFIRTFHASIYTVYTYIHTV